jgi:hypothetical protein
VLDLARNALAPGIDTIIREAAGIAFGYEDLELVLGEPLAESGANIFQVLWIAP